MVNRTVEQEKLTLRSKYKYNSDDFIILYIAEFIPLKDHGFFIKNIPELKKQIPNLNVIMPGRGVQLKEMKILAVNLEVDDIIWFPGYRKDINLLCAISDLYVTTSRQEGLPISVIEAMASGLPIVASNIRGQTDAVLPGRNGELYQLDNNADFVGKILELYKNPELRTEMRKNNIEDSRKYSVDIAVKKMAEIFQLKGLTSEIHLTMEQNITFHKAFSKGESFAKKNVRPKTCLICNSSNEQFCKSHSIPARCLRAIAENGNVKVFNGLVKIPSMDNTKGVGEAGTFRLICRECDDKTFKNYETFEKYSNNLSDRTLHEIVLKNYLKLYKKKLIEEKAFPEILNNLSMQNIKILDPILNTGKIDKKDFYKLFCKTKKLLNSNTNGYYRILDYRKLSYNCLFAFQCAISLITGFDGEIINDVFNNNKNYLIQDLHICVFPEKEYTYVILFYRKDYQRYSKFAKHYMSLNDEEKLQLLFFLIIKYSEDFFYSPLIQEIDTNLYIQKAMASTTMTLCSEDDNKVSELKKCIEEYDLNQFYEIPNILSKEYIDKILIKQKSTLRF